MIRIVLISAAFFSVTIALLVIQPGPDPRDAVAPTAENDVTRTQTDLSSLQEVVRPATEPTAAEAAEISDDALGFGLSDALDITPEPSEPTPQATSIIAKLQGTSQTAATQPAPQATPDTDDPLERLVIRALNQGQSEGYIDALVNHAAQTGEVTVPESLITSDGRVDTSALLTALSPAATQPGPGKGTYVVEPGDTLASIAYRFYGQTSARHQIFDANKDRINASGHLQVGLELVLPAN